jgi:molecular chaperone GrpE
VVVPSRAPACVKGCRTAKNRLRWLSAPIGACHKNMKKAEHDKTNGKNPPPPAAPPPEGAEPVTVVPLTPDQIEELQTRAAKADENWDRLLRTTADFENFKKRAARERIETAQSATAVLIEKLLPVLDHFEMAQAAAQSAQDDKLGSLQAGFAMIQQQMKTILTECGLEEIDAAGKPFDPAWHEAVSQQETLEIPEGHVSLQLRKGYKLRERLLRPATVVVARKPAENPV